MKTTIATPLLAAAISALIALPVSAATPSDTTGVESQTATPAPDLLQPESRAERTEPLQMGDRDPLTDPAEGSIMQLTPDQLKHMAVVDPAGKEVGKIEQIVRSRQDETIEAVISSGGVLGFGAKEIAVPIETLELAGNEQLQIQASDEELQARGDYVPEAFVQLEPSDRPISEFSAFEPVSGAPENQDSMMLDTPQPDAGATGTEDTHTEGQY